MVDSSVNTTRLTVRILISVFEDGVEMGDEVEEKKLKTFLVRLCGA